MTAGMTFVMVIIVLLQSPLKYAKKCKKIREKFYSLQPLKTKAFDIVNFSPNFYVKSISRNFPPNLEHYVDVSRVTYLVHDVVVGENYFYHLGLEVWVVYGGIQHNPHQVGAVGVAVDPHSTPACFQ